MSMDNGHVIRKNDAGQFVLQNYSMSSDLYPEIDRVSDDQKFDTLVAAIAAYNCGQYPYGRYCDEYGLTISPECTRDAKRTREKIQSEDLNIPWDTRDFELGLPSKMQSVIAQITSGIEGAKPTGDDLILANRVRSFIEQELLKD